MFSSSLWIVDGCGFNIGCNRLYYLDLSWGFSESIGNMLGVSCFTRAAPCRGSERVQGAGSGDPIQHILSGTMVNHDIVKIHIYIYMYIDMI